MVLKKIVPSLFITFSLLLTGCSTTKTHQEEPARTVVSGLKLGSVEKKSLSGYEIAGTVKAFQVTNIAPQTTGRVKEVLVREGALVSQGQVLVVLDAPDTVQRTSGAGQQVMAAAAASQLADATYNRMLSLYQSDAISKQELDRAYAAQQSAAAEAARARAGFAESAAVEEYLNIRAPYDGQVTRQLAEVGALVSANQPLISIEDPSHYEVEAWVDVAQAGKVTSGMSVDIQRNDESLQKGKILYVSPSVTPDARSFLIKILLPGKDWRSGEYVRVQFPFEIAKKIAVPRSAVQERGQLTGVYVVGQDNVISFRLIRLGRTSGNDVEVISGLTGEERIVVSGVENAVDGGLWKGEAS